MILIKVRSHSREDSEYLTSCSIDAFIRPLKLNLLTLFTFNISTSLSKFGYINLALILVIFMLYNFDRASQSLL